MALDKLQQGASLNEAVEFTNSIKNEILSLKTTLANNITNKGVTASNSETLTSLIGKVKNIKDQSKVKAGTSKTLGTISGGAVTSSSFVQIGIFDILTVGTVTIKTGLKTYSTSGAGVKVELVRNSVSVNSFQNSVSSQEMDPVYFYNNLDVKIGDVIKIYGRSNTNTYNTTILATSVTCDI